MDSILSFNLFRSKEPLHDSGIAFTRGFEILLKKNLTKNFYGTISLSLFRSRYKNLQGEWTKRLNDNQYILTAIGGYDTGSSWRFSIRFNLAGGVPYTPCDIERSREHNSWIIDDAHINAKRYPAYISLNVRADHKFNIKKYTLNVYLSILNVLNRKNILSYYWNKLDNQLGTMYQAPILPMFGIEFSF